MCFYPFCFLKKSKFQQIKIQMLLYFSKFQIFKNSKCQITRPDFQFGVPKKHKVATNIILYNRYREILFQKVASCYLLHFVQDGSSKHALEKSIVHINLKSRKLHSPASILEHWTNVKLRQKYVYIKYTGKSSSRKLRHVIYYTLYKMDPQKTH